MHLIDYFLPKCCLVCDSECSASLCAQCWPALIDLKIKRCPKCYKIWDLFDERTVCVRCQLRPSVIMARRYLWNYGAVTRDFLNTLKYRPSRELCAISAQILSDSLPLFWKSVFWDYKLAVPSDRKMLFRRGFNQVELLIRNLPGINLTSRLQHSGYRSPQATLNHEERVLNVQNVFKFQGRLDGGKILLVDDMVTTGATAEAISQTLMQAGAQEIYLLSLSSKY